jgi:hypothetical protein
LLISTRYLFDPVYVSCFTRCTFGARHEVDSSDETLLSREYQPRNVAPIVLCQTTVGMLRLQTNGIKNANFLTCLRKSVLTLGTYMFKFEHTSTDGIFLSHTRPHMVLSFTEVHDGRLTCNNRPVSKYNNCMTSSVSHSLLHPT